MERRATMTNQSTQDEHDAPIAPEKGDIDGDPAMNNLDKSKEMIAGSSEVYRGGIAMKAKGQNYRTEEKSNPYIERVNAATLEEDDSTTDEMLIQKTFKPIKGAGQHNHVQS